MKHAFLAATLFAAGVSLAGCVHAPRQTTIDDVSTDAAKILAIDDRPVDRMAAHAGTAGIAPVTVGAGAHELLVLRRGRGPGSRAETQPVPVRIDVHRRYKLDVVAGKVRVTPLGADR